MANLVTLETFGDWAGDVNVSMDRVLRASMDAFGEPAEKTIRKAVFFMAQSASKIARKVKTATRRKVTANPKFAHLLKTAQYKKQAMGGADMARYFRFTAKKLRQKGGPKDLFANTKAVNNPRGIAKIKRRKLLADSWLMAHKKRTKNKYIFGATSLTESRRALGSGGIFTVELSNFIGYAEKAMPGGWTREVERRTMNRIMGSLRKRVEKQWRKIVFSGGKSTAGMGALGRKFAGL